LVEHTAIGIVGVLRKLPSRANASVRAQGL
jgi:hypothetical protein